MPNPHSIPIIHERLVARAFVYAATHGYRLGGGARQDFQGRLLLTAARRVKARIRGLGEGEAEKIVRSAERSVDKLVKHMIQASVQIPGYRRRNPSTIGEETLAAALNGAPQLGLKGICPLWPICR